MPATWTGAPAGQRLLPILLNGGDGSDGAFSSSSSPNYSGISGVSADGNAVYIGNFTTFAINDGHTVTLDNSRNLLLATGAVTLGSGSSGVIDGDDNGPTGGSGIGSQGPSQAGHGWGRGEGGESNDSSDGGGGGGSGVNGTDGANHSNSGGKEQSWLDYFVTGDTNRIPGAGGGGAGCTQMNVNAGGMGGDAGATLVIVSEVSITVNDGFTWTSDGATGSNGTGTSGGGGGGAGGACILCAPKITMAETTGTVIGLLGGSGGTGGGGSANGGAGAVGRCVLLYQDWYSVGGTLMGSANLASRTDPDAVAYQFRPYVGRSGRIL